MTKLSDLIREGRIDEATAIIVGQMNEATKPTIGMHAKDFKKDNTDVFRRAEKDDEPSDDDLSIMTVYERLEANSVAGLKKYLERADNFIINLLVPYIHPSFYDDLGLNLYDKYSVASKYAKRFGLEGVSKIGKVTTTATKIFRKSEALVVGAVVDLEDGRFYRIDNIYMTALFPKQETTVEYTFQDALGTLHNTKVTGKDFFEMGYERFGM